MHGLQAPIDPSPVDPSDIDVSSPEDFRTSFRSTDLESALPLIRARFPNIDTLYLIKIFRGTVGPTGLIWLDIGRQDTSPLDFSDIAHLVYCFEVYGQIICILASPQGIERELELQHALADYRIRLLKLSKWATFESLKGWHSAFLETRFQDGQDRPEGWRELREDLATLLRRSI
ncbi:MAG: hypothetical protein L6R39_005989 [Caloplaca ligustica]|nr:MAG: hypothetical protein L6R39_005989 [Caloplaca ligustica]